MSKLTAWFDALTLRERWIVGIGVPLAISALLYFVVIQSLQKQRAKTQKRTETAHEQLREMQTLATSLPLTEKTQDVNEIFGADLVSGENGKLKSQPLDEVRAKALFLRLAQRGNASLTRMEDGRWQVWFDE